MTRGALGHCKVALLSLHAILQFELQTDAGLPIWGQYIQQGSCIYARGTPSTDVPDAVCMGPYHA
jgi:hypothetical protein